MKFIKLGKRLLINPESISFISFTPTGEAVIHCHGASKVSASYEDTCAFLEKLAVATNSPDALEMCEEIIGTPKRI
jgi:hypothetical protein